MHVVDATLFFSPTSGGVKRYLLAKHEWMRAHTSWRHSLVVPGEMPTHVPGDISMVAGGKVPGAFNYRLPLNPLSWSRAIDALEPDLIEVGDAFHPAWAASRVARRRGIPLVAFYHSNFPQLAGRRLGPAVQKLIEWYVRLTYERCEVVLAPSRHTCDYLHSIGVRHATTQPLGVDVDTFHPDCRGRDLATELNLPRGTRLLAFAGRFSAEKNIPVLTAAFRKLGAPYHLLLIGGDESRREGNVTRIPYCRDNRQLASYLASADAFVHAGLHETFGLVVLEAMACGRPVVAMRAGALPELIDTNAGVLAEPHDDEELATASLASAVSSLYERDLDALGAAARRHVESNYSWSRALQGLMTRYQAAVSARQRVAVETALPSAGTIQ
ncbi:MAG: glycosyltransferase family 1 protein [Steroidobacteraceae bacterium]|jgi:alpha-1,6-mannosyltransferase|nr:glycosyltransferase family 1 protein [Steroidobacteraceae bacterium]